MLDSINIKFNEAVWHDQPYMHPQGGKRMPRDFYDRSEVKTKARLILAMPGVRQPILLIGERRGGKTSALKWLMHLLEGNEQFVVVSIPWFGIRSATDLLREILYGLYFKLEAFLPKGDRFPAAFKEITTTAEFLHALQEMLNSVPNRTLILGIDELDSILVEAENQTESAGILALVNALAETTPLPIRLIITTTRAPGEMKNGHGSPLNTRSLQVHLHPFRKADLDDMTRELLGPNIQLANRDLAALFELSGGWPYFAKLLLVHMAELNPGEEWLERACGLALEDTRLTQSLEHIYEKHLNDAEKTVVLLLAKRGGHLTQREMQVLDHSLGLAARRLVQRDFLTEEEGGGFHFRIGLLRDWFSRWIQLDEQVDIYLQDRLVSLERLEETPDVQQENKTIGK